MINYGIAPKKLHTMKVVFENGIIVNINKSDYDPKIHKLFTEKPSNKTNRKRSQEIVSKKQIKKTEQKEDN